ncbi:MAG: DUF4886 domain-containing protein [Sphingomonas sp.]
MIASPLLLAALAAAPVQATADSAPQTILFVGNSFTFGANSPVWKYRADSVADLNHDGVGGVPALFKLFTVQAGLNYAVSLEASGGKTLGWHLANKSALLDRPWDHVVLQQYSTLDPDHPGDPATTIADAARLAHLFTAANPKVAISLTATWSRPDQTYRPGGHWYGKPITAMALDIQHGDEAAAAATPAIDRVNPVGSAFNCAIAAGVADPDPYDGTSFGTVDLWAFDHYHASRFGDYLEALTVFIDVTGVDPRTFGEHETAANELGIAPADAVRLQRVAWAAMHGLPCTPAAIDAPR